jgi:glucan 1,3-beta-glucosidase
LQFGGFWVDDPDDPFSNNAQPNSWTPPLNTTWQFGEDRIYGVNLGGLFVLEPFIVPALFEKYQVIFASEKLRSEADTRYLLEWYGDRC